MITEPLFYAIAIFAVIVTGMSKGGFGGGLGALSVPLMALIISPVQAAAIMLPVLIAMDMGALWSFRGSWDKQNVKLMMPGVIIGIIIGAFGFRYLSEDAIRILIGVISVFFVLNYYLKRGPQDATKANAAGATFWGALTGFTSFGIHAGGPPASVYLLPQKMDKTLLMGTIAVLFTMINAIKVIPYTILGQFNSDNLLTSLILVPFALIGVRLGYYLLNKVSQELIYQICYFALGVAGIKLLWEGIKGILA